MMTDPITASRAPAPSAAAPATPPAANRTADADFTTFLTLLTTQLRNQDPLKPVDSTEFVAQLASFSTVEQQTRTNELLEDLLAATGTAAALRDAASWIGLEVSAPGSGAFDGVTPVGFFVDPPASARSAEMTVYNDFGQPVARLAVPPDMQDVRWDGMDSTGTVAPVGIYHAEVSFALADETVVRPAQPYATVEEVRLIDGTPTLLLDSGGSVGVAVVGAVRESSAA